MEETPDRGNQLMENYVTNKELVKSLINKIEKLDRRLQETERIITKYNGLREKMMEQKTKINNESAEISKLKKKITRLETEKETKGALTVFITNQLGWIIAFVTLLYYIFG